MRIAISLCIRPRPRRLGGGPRPRCAPAPARGGRGPPPNAPAPLTLEAPPRQHPEMKIERLSEREPGAHVGGPVGLVAELAAGHVDAVDDLYRVHPDAASLIHDSIGHIEEGNDLPGEARLLGQLAEHAARRRLTEIQTTTWQRPDAARRDPLDDPAQQHAVLGVAAQAVGGDAGTPARAHGASNRAR